MEDCVAGNLFNKVPNTLSKKKVNNNYSKARVIDLTSSKEDWDSVSVKYRLGVKCTLTLASRVTADIVFLVNMIN